MDREDRHTTVHGAAKTQTRLSDYHNHDNNNAACRVLVTRSGIEPQAQAVKVPSPNYWTTREIPKMFAKDF